MAQKAKITKTTRSRTKKVPNGYVSCNMCHGKGYYKRKKS